MIRELRFLDAAIQDLQEIADYYGQEREGLGLEFLSLVNDYMKIIRSTPERFEKIRPQIRRATMKNFSYQIFFRVRSHFVKIVAVHHNHRDSAGFRSRWAKE